MMFHEVWGRSLCRSLERMVEVELEYPGAVEYVFSPACVLLRRCSGCCSDENLVCFPTLTHNVTMQVIPVAMTTHVWQVILARIQPHPIHSLPFLGYRV